MTHRYFIYLSVLCLFVFQLIGAAMNPSGMKVRASGPQRQIISGKVTAKDGNTFTIQEGEFTAQVHIPSEASVKRNAMNASLAQIEKDDQVAVMQNADGKIEALQATSGSIVEMTKWIIPVGLLSVASAILTVAGLRQLTQLVGQRLQRRSFTMPHISNISAG